MCVAPFALSNIVFRTYRPEDEKACEHLEERANQFRSTKLQDIFLIGGLLQRLKESMIQVKMSHGNCGFDARTQARSNRPKIGRKISRKFLVK
jgi:hypothetical protein